MRPSAGDQRHLLGQAHRLPWQDLPERYGPWKTAYQRFRRWAGDGTWARLKARVVALAGAECGRVTGTARHRPVPEGGLTTKVHTPRRWAGAVAGHPDHSRAGRRHQAVGAAAGAGSSAPAGWSRATTQPPGLSNR
ncbi:MAG: transposase [Mycobacteriales bacterium]